MKRRKALRRKTPLRSRGKGSYARRPRDLAYMRKVKTFPCVVPEIFKQSIFTLMRSTPCSGPVEADHLIKTVSFRKGPDRKTVSICRQHHSERHHLTGAFADFDKATMAHFKEVALEVIERWIVERDRRYKRYS